MIEIRKENKNDYKEVYEVVKTAFESAEHSDGNEHDLVDLLRKSDNFIPELSLVATSNGKIVGYIMFTKVKIGDSIQLALAPLAVLPEYQRKGIGSALIKEGHKIANDYSIVLGSEKYYPKMGYLPAINYGIMPSFEVPDENFMACKLNENTVNISGIVEYAKEFGI